MSSPEGGSPGSTEAQGSNTEASDLSQFHNPDSAAVTVPEVAPEASDLSRFHKPEAVREGEETSRIRNEETAQRVAAQESAADARDKIAVQPGSFDEAANQRLSQMNRDRAAELTRADQSAVVEAGTDPVRNTVTKQPSLGSRIRRLLRF